MDFALKPELRNNRIVFASASFNPCFDGFCSITGGAIGNVIIPGKVSILVLMDFALKQSGKLALAHLFRGFNPCFDGFCSKTITLRYHGMFYQGFNPCFDGFCSKTSHSQLHHRKLKCFNPCFDGFCSKTFFALFRFLSLILFQSLF